MTRDDIIRMAHKAGFNMFHYSNKEPLLCEAWGDEIHLERFAELVAAAEREACAKLCDAYTADKWNEYKGRPPYEPISPGRADPHVQGLSCGGEDCATAIRARTESERREEFFRKFGND